MLVRLTPLLLEYDILFNIAQATGDTVDVYVADVTTRKLQKKKLKVDKELHGHMPTIRPTMDLHRLLGGDEHKRVTGDFVTSTSVIVVPGNGTNPGIGAWYLTYEGRIPRIHGVSFTSIDGPKTMVGNVVFFKFYDVEGSDSLYFITDLHKPPAADIRFHGTIETEKRRNENEARRLAAFRDTAVARKCHLIETLHVEGKPRCVCGNPGEKRCGGCKKIYYCSRVCQSTDWSVHKIVCRV